MKSFLEQSEGIWVGMKELEDSLLSPEDNICITTFAELVLEEEDTTVLWLTNEKLWRKEVADAARFVEPARNQRDEEKMNKTAASRTSQVPDSDDKQQKILELEDAIAALRAENSIRVQERDRAAQNSTKGTE